MENQYTTERLALTLVAVALLSACTSAPVVVSPPAPAKPVQLGITQAGFGPSARYVYCEEGACPAPTRKTLAAAGPVIVPAALRTFEGRTLWHTVDIAFPFNSARISEADRQKLADAAAQYGGGNIEISARSDFVGPVEGQKKVVAARASAMRRIVAKQSQGAQISERQEVAGPTRVADAEQAQQRRGTVRFTPPTDVQLKGSQP